MEISTIPEIQQAHRKNQLLSLEKILQLLLKLVIVLISKDDYTDEMKLLLNPKQ